jgi:hypothetical protein
MSGSVPAIVLSTLALAMLLVVCLAQPNEPSAPLHTVAVRPRATPSTREFAPVQPEMRMQLHVATRPTVPPVLPVRSEPLHTLPSSSSPALQVDAPPRAALPLAADATAAAGEPDPHAN